MSAAADRWVRAQQLISEQPRQTDRPNNVADRLQRICRAAATALSAYGAGVSVMTSQGTWGFAVASDPACQHLEELQFALGEGPWMEAIATSRPVFVLDVSDGTTSRWPIYASAVQEYGVRSVFAFPLRTAATRLDVLDVFRMQAGQMSQDDIAQSFTFAEIAQTAMLDGQDNAPAGAVPEGLDEAPGHRAEVFQAQGMIMVQLDVSLAEALVRMRARAYAEGRPLADVARDVVARTLRSTRASSHDRRLNVRNRGTEVAVTTLSAHRLARVFVEVSDTLVDEFDLLDFLHMLTLRTAELAAASVVGLVLADRNGNLQFMAASREDARLLELFQLQNDEGPCLDAFRSGSPVVNTDLRKDSIRWPLFAPHATAAGFRSVHAFPLRLRARVIGALNVFGADDGAHLEAEDVPLVQALADLASIALLQERTIRERQVLTEQLQGALNSRVIIEQAKGAIAQSRGVNVDEAFMMIRNYARRNNRHLGRGSPSHHRQRTGHPRVPAPLTALGVRRADTAWRSRRRAPCFSRRLTDRACGLRSTVRDVRRQAGMGIGGASAPRTPAAHPSYDV